MFDFPGFLGTVDTFLDLIRSALNSRRDRQTELLELLRALISAIAASRRELRSRYGDDSKVKELWDEVLVLSVVLDDASFTEMASKKLAFWSDPEMYLNDANLLQLVPRLEEFEKICEDILQEFEAL